MRCRIYSIQVGIIQSRQSTARARLAECMDILKALGDRQGLATTMEACAGPRRRRAARGGASSGRRRAIASGSYRFATFEARRGSPDTKLAQDRRAVGPESAAVALEDGARMGIDEAVHLAIETD